MHCLSLIPGTSTGEIFETCGFSARRSREVRRMLAHRIASLWSSHSAIFQLCGCLKLSSLYRHWQLCFILQQNLSIIRWWIGMYLPESATKSTMSRPWASNLEMSISRVELGAGIIWFARVMLALRESFLPKYTSQLGPPLCRKSLQLKLNLQP